MLVSVFPLQKVQLLITTSSLISIQVTPPWTPPMEMVIGALKIRMIGHNAPSLKQPLLGHEEVAKVLVHFYWLVVASLTSSE